MKKIFKIIFVNIIILLLILVCFEFVLYKIDNAGDPFFQLVKDLNALKYKEMYDEIINAKYYEQDKKGISYKNFRRPLIYNESGLKPIILFGCSFAWGCQLNESQTFHYKLSKLMKRSVYNRALCAWGTQHMLYQLKQNDFYNEFPEPEYIIYLYISTHIERIYKYPFINKWGSRSGYNYLRYIDTKYGLKEEKRCQFVPYSKIYNEIILPKLMEAEARKNGFKLLEKHLIEAKKEVDKHWKNVKFVILDYEADNYFNNYREVLNKENVEKLKKEGFIVIKTSELTDVKLGDNFVISGADKHPNEAAWDLITPLFVKKLQEYK